MCFKTTMGHMKYYDSEDDQTYYFFKNYKYFLSFKPN